MSNETELMLSKLEARGLVDDFEAVGSRVTCVPAPTETDEDWLVLASDFRKFIDHAAGCGFDHDGSDLLDSEGEDAFGDFASLSLDGVNLIVTGDHEFYRRFKAASSVARRFNLLDKAARIALFQAVLYGNECDQPTPNEANHADRTS